jgi:hypothetical protein
MKLNLNNIFQLLIVEIIISTLPISTIMILTYIFKGENGIERLLDGYISITEKINLWSTIILLVIGITLWFLSYFYNLKNKYIIKEVSKNFFDIGINILRIGTGVLYSFSILYFLFNGFNKNLVSFIIVGSCTLVESSFFAWLKISIFEKKLRRITVRI